MTLPFDVFKEIVCFIRVTIKAIILIITMKVFPVLPHYVPAACRTSSDVCPFLGDSVSSPFFHVPKDYQLSCYSPRGTAVSVRTHWRLGGVTIQFCLCPHLRKAPRTREAEAEWLLLRPSWAT